MADEDKEKAEKIAAAKKRVGNPPSVWLHCKRGSYDGFQATRPSVFVTLAIVCLGVIFSNLQLLTYVKVRAIEEEEGGRRKEEERG
jgi:hypothetical protein